MAWIALLAFLAATMGVSRLDLGPGNLIANMVIAVLKASIVYWIFMELAVASARIRLFALGALAWVAVMFALTFLDAGFRR